MQNASQGGKGAACGPADENQGAQDPGAGAHGGLGDRREG